MGGVNLSTKTQLKLLSYEELYYLFDGIDVCGL